VFDCLLFLCMRLLSFLLSQSVSFAMITALLQRSATAFMLPSRRRLLSTASQYHSVRPISASLNGRRGWRGEGDVDARWYRQKVSLGWQGYGKSHRQPSSRAWLSSAPIYDVKVDMYTDDVYAGINVGNEASHDGVNGDACVYEVDSKAAEDLFVVTSKYQPAGDQPQAIAQLICQMKERKEKYNVLKGITGTGKTLVMSHIIAAIQRPTLVLCHNKTLAIQLARELQSCLKENAVELFVSYYNHYVPESYNEKKDRYIAKKTAINLEVEALRHRATRTLLTRRDVVVVASVSCIYGIGLPQEYMDLSMPLQLGGDIEWDATIEHLHSMLYTDEPDDGKFSRGHYQLHEEHVGVNGHDASGLESSMSVNGGGVVRTVNIWPVHDKYPLSLEFAQQGGDGAFVLSAIRKGTVSGMVDVDSTHIFPARHHVTTKTQMAEACDNIERELKDRLIELRQNRLYKEADILEQRTMQDLDLLRSNGYCKGAENYSRHLGGRAPGQPPYTLMDFLNLQGDWLMIVDESHVALPQLKAMYNGDRQRKESLVKHGYRLPSALDNRPLKNDEFWQAAPQTLFVSATPSQTEVNMAVSSPVPMEIRPTYVCDPEVEVRPRENQLSDLLKEIRDRTAKRQRTLVMTLTKRDAEDLNQYLLDENISSNFVHSGMATDERSKVLRDLQRGDLECVVGVNCLREGLDLPQVSLVAILNADSEGFLRSETALLQTIGRAARNVDGKAILYANRVTESMDKCIRESKRRRERQLEYLKDSKVTMQSTEGSSMLTIFDLLKDEIASEMGSDAMTGERSPNGHRIAGASSPERRKVQTDHLPNSPGVYFWKDTDGHILYIGKANKLRSRVKSYMSASAKHSPRIRAMVDKAASVDFMVTPSHRDALVLESNMIKHHMPLYNVLMKDDQHYPYICASVGDSLPRFFVSPQKSGGEDGKSAQYKYFGPYTSFAEIYVILDEIERKYDLRRRSFDVRQGSASREEYMEKFESALQDVFLSKAKPDEETIQQKRREFEEANLLFESPHNKCRDVVAVSRVNNVEALVLVVQLRDGIVAGKFSYLCTLHTNSEDNYADIIQTVLAEKHYPSGEMREKYTWFPTDILTSHAVVDADELQKTVKDCRAKVEGVKRRKVAVSTQSSRGGRVDVDARALQFAQQNADEEVRLMLAREEAETSAATELAEMLQLEKKPSYIECYDISHTQGEDAVGSRVVFIDGEPAPHLYRRFNIKTVEGVDDYACLEEVLERRFRRAMERSEDADYDATEDPWSMPDLVVIDGGIGQLGAAIKGMSKSNVSAKVHGTKSENIDGIEVAVCALAKNQEQVYVHGKRDPVNDRPDSPGLLLLRSLRDESHRFALSKWVASNAVVSHYYFCCYCCWLLIASDSFFVLVC
jgi:excinuclease ABC subunit B